MFFKNIISSNTYREQNHLKYDGGFVVFKECLIDFYDRPYKKIKRSVYGKKCEYFLNNEDCKEKHCFIPIKQN